MGQQGHRPIYFRLKIVGSMDTVATNMVQSGPTSNGMLFSCLVGLVGLVGLFNIFYKKKDEYKRKQMCN